MSYGIIMGPNTYDWFMKQLDKIVRRMNREERKRKKAPAINPKFKSTIVMADDGSPMKMYYIPMPKDK